MLSPLSSFLWWPLSTKLSLVPPPPAPVPSLPYLVKDLFSVRERIRAFFHLGEFLVGIYYIQIELKDFITLSK